MHDTLSDDQMMICARYETNPSEVQMVQTRQDKMCNILAIFIIMRVRVCVCVSVWFFWSKSFHTADGS